MWSELVNAYNQSLQIQSEENTYRSTLRCKSIHKILHPFKNSVFYEPRPQPQWDIVSVTDTEQSGDYHL